jgi:hypothetical protein
MRVLLRKCFRGHNELFEWTVNGKTWYPINYKRIQPIHNGGTDPFRALEPFRKAMTKMRAYPGFHISVFEAEYDKQKKILSVKAHA